MNGLAVTIETVETTTRILRSLADVSRRIGGAGVADACAKAVQDGERRLAILRELSAQAQARARLGFRAEPSPAPPRRTPLSPREWDVAQLIARGCTNQQIAAQLVLTPGTVANHVAHILTKLDLRSRTQIAVWVLNHDRGPEA
jgi:DNA-binding NarL/FixJ family response regulator